MADEPVSSLDVSIQAQIINLFRHLQAEHGFSFLFIAHDLAMVRYLCDRVGVMYRGKLVECAPAEELFQHPLHGYTRALFSAIPLPDPIRRAGAEARPVRRSRLPSDGRLVEAAPAILSWKEAQRNEPYPILARAAPHRADACRQPVPALAAGLCDCRTTHRATRCAPITATAWKK